MSTSTTGPSLARTEREALADLLLQVGPDAPTLCEGWTAKDLATHLVVRERRPDAAAGMFIPPLAKHLEQVSAKVESRPFSELVEQFRQGPPLWSPMRPLDRVANLAENLVHHEDVRRAAGTTTPRALSRADQDQVWATLGRMAKMFLRKAEVPVVLERTDVSDAEPITVAGKASAAAGKDQRVVVSGEPVELLLWLFGRDQVAEVQIQGPVDRARRSSI